MRDLLVSVVIPTFNDVTSLPRAILSVQKQTYRDFEIIVVDDGSTDDTRACVEEFIKSDSRVKYFYQNNNGLGSARNLGIRKSQGSLIAFLDADDEWLDEKLFLQVRALEGTSSEVGFCFCDFFKIYGHGKYSDINSEKIPSNFFIGVITAKCSALPSTLIIKKSVIESIGYFSEEKSLHLIEDIDFNIRLGKDFKYVFIKKPLVKYTMEKVKAAQKGLDKISMKNYFSLLEHYTKKYEEQLRFLNIYLYSQQLRFLGNGFCRVGQMKKGRNYLVKSLKVRSLNVKTLSMLLLSILGGKLYFRVYVYKFNRSLDRQYN